MRENLNQILTKHTLQPKEKIQEDIERDFIMTPERAKAYGIIDSIIVTRKKSGETSE
jgi:ATP-dependent Clp protease protease subunit